MPASVRSSATDQSTLDEFFAHSVVPGSSKYWAAHFAAPLQKPQIMAVMCYAHLMDELSLANSDVIREKSVWWHEELERLADRQARHPVTKVLATGEHSPLIESLHEQLHGALMTQQKIVLDNAESFTQYRQLRLGSLIKLLELIAGQENEAAGIYASWAAATMMTDLLRNPSAYKDGRWTRPTLPEQVQEEILAGLNKLAGKKPHAGSAACEIIVQHELQHLRKGTSSSSPFYANRPLGMWAMLRSWRIARKHQSK